MHCKVPSFGDRWQSQPIYSTLRKGPWLSGAFLEQFKEALQNFIAEWKTNRPFWDIFHEQICHDLDISIDTSCDEVLQMLVDEKTLELTGPYVTMDELWIVFFVFAA